MMLRYNSIWREVCYMKLFVTTKKKPSLKHVLFALLLISLAVIWFFILEKIHYNCPWLYLFHVYCPGCGGMRMILSILHLDFYQAFRYNPFLFILFILGLIYLIIMLIIYKKKKVFILPSRNFWIFILILLVLFAVLRNFETFSYLIPTEV